MDFFVFLMHDAMFPSVLILLAFNILHGSIEVLYFLGVELNILFAQADAIFSLVYMHVQVVFGRKQTLQLLLEKR